MMSSDAFMYFFPRSFDSGLSPVTLERVEQVVEPVEDRAEAVLDDADSERDREVGLPDPRRPLDEHRLVLADPPAGRQRLDERPRDLGLEAEVPDRLADGQSREA